MKLIKINDRTYEVLDIQCQLTFGTHASLFLSFDIIKNRNYKHEITDLFDQSITFNISTTQFISKSNRIKFLDIDKNILNIQIISELFENIPIEQRRHELIESILREETTTGY